MRYNVMKCVTIEVAVEADTEDEALQVADGLLLDDWDKHETITIDVTAQVAA